MNKVLYICCARNFEIFLTLREIFYTRIYIYIYISSNFSGCLREPLQVKPSFGNQVQGHRMPPRAVCYMGQLKRKNAVAAALVNTFSDVVICRRFRPAGGQPFLRAFLRLPDRNPLKRLEQLFRVIFSRERERKSGETRRRKGGER